MRSWIAVVVGIALQVSTPGEASAQSSPVPAAELTRLRAIGSDWRRSGGPLLFGGSQFYPSGPTVFFDGLVMVRGGSFEGVPIYIDSTRNPANVVYVPVAGGLMRPYERRRADQVADTLVAAPSLPAPVFVETEAPIAAIPTPEQTAIALTTQAGTAVYGPTAVQSIPSPRGNRGIWIEFGGRIWLATGAGGPSWAGRFTQVGTYHGFPVYQEPARVDQIFVPSVPGGPVARYSLSDERATNSPDVE